MRYDEPFYRPSRTAKLGGYTTRWLVGLLGSLAVIVIVLRVPMLSSSPQVKWTTQRPAELISLQNVRAENPTTETAPTRQDAPPPTRHESPPVESSQITSSDGRSEGNEASEQKAEKDSPASVVRLAALSADDGYPRIIGGTGTLYLNIDYPREAIRNQIQGRLKLTFTVGRDGTVRRIRVTESLHPLCDSAAVAGLRSVQFHPATRNGEPVPVRMSLPIRFRLKQNSDLPLQSTRNTSSNQDRPGARPEQEER